MVSLTTLNSTLGIINSVGCLLGPKVSRVIDSYSRAAAVGGPITNVTRQTTILSRIFIDDSVSDEVVLGNLMKSFHEWYAAQILAALQLQALVDDKRTVQTIMRTVQTGDNPHQRGVIGNLVERHYGAASFLEKVGVESNNGPQPLSVKEGTRIYHENKKLQEEINTLKATNPSMHLRSIAASENKIGPMGELFEVTLTNPKDGKFQIKVPVFIQMRPSLIPAKLAPRFIDMNVSQALWYRWTQLKAGELTFWRDFILQRDQIQRKRAFLKDPKAAKAFSEFLQTVSKKDSYALADVTAKSAEPHSSNLANSVIVFSEDTVRQAKIDSNIDLHNEADRLRYFKDTYSMIVAIIDPMHQRVIVYFNGIDGVMDCSYQDFRPKDKNFDPNDFVKALSAFSTGSLSRLR